MEEPKAPALVRDHSITEGSQRGEWIASHKTPNGCAGDCDSALTSSLRKGGTEVDYQVAAPIESSTHNLHRATIAQQRVRMEGWRQRRLGMEDHSMEDHSGKEKRALSRNS